MPMTMLSEVEEKLQENESYFENLQDKARTFMAEHGFIYDGDFPETGEGKQEKFNGEEERKDERSWLKSSYFESKEGTPGLCITFGRFDGIQERITKTFWQDDTSWIGLSKEEKDASRRVRKEAQRLSKEKAENDKKIADELANKIQNRFTVARVTPPKDTVTYFSKKGLENLYDIHNLHWECHQDYSSGVPQEKWVALVALRNGRGDLRAIQELWPEKCLGHQEVAPRNKNYSGKTAGCFFTSGTLENGREILVAEGVATAISCFKATNKTAIAAMDCGNLQKVVKDLRTRYPDSPITICADNDHHREREGNGNPGLETARKVAIEFSCKLAVPQFPAEQEFDNNGSPRTDFDDLRQLLDNVAVKEQVETAQVVVEVSNEDANDTDEVVEILRALNRNETGDAELFVSEFQNMYLWDPSEGKYGSWFRCEKGYWILDDRKRRYRDFESIADRYAKIAINITDKTTSEELAKRVKALRTTRRRSAVLETASAYLALPAREDGAIMWDATIDLLACKNGIVIDLTRGTTRQAESKDFIRTFCPTEYNPKATCPMFEQFLLDIFLGKADLIAFVQRLLGYIILGNPQEEIVVIFYGPEGRNGKGTLVQTLEFVLGAIAHTFPSEMLLLQKTTRSPDAATPNLAQLAGCRLAIFSEINKGRRIDASQVKNLSGKDTIPCRRLFSNVDLKIKPTHTMILQTNFLPKAPADDNALWTRTIVVPFEAHFNKDPDKNNPNHKQADTRLKDKLKEEASGILNWLIEGTSQYLRLGLGIPNAVKVQTNQYRRDSDAVAKFLEECCEIAPEFSTPKDKMLKALKAYAEENCMEVPTRNEITAQLRERFQEQHQRNGSIWKGISIRPEEK